MEPDRQAETMKYCEAALSQKFLADLIRAPLITWNYMQILNCLCCEVKKKKVWSQFDFSFSKIACSRFELILKNGFYPVLVRQLDSILLLIL